MSKLVSIMIPTYNQPEYFEECIESVLNQTYENIEIIISDDSTNDEIENIVKTKYIKNPKIKYFHNRPPLGRVKNYRTTLYEKTRGEYVVNLDGDDFFIDEHFIEDAVKLFEKDKDIVCIVAKSAMYDNAKKQFKYPKVNSTLQSIMDGCEYLYKYSLHYSNDKKVSFFHLSTIYKRDMALEIGFYDKDIIFSDGESIFRLMCGNKIGYLDKFVGAWRVHFTNTTNAFQHASLEEIFFLENSVYNFCKDKCDSFDKWLINMKNKRFYGLYKGFIKTKKFKDLFKLLNELRKKDKEFFYEFLKFLFLRVFKKN